MSVVKWAEWHLSLRHERLTRYRMIHASRDMSPIMREICC